MPMILWTSFFISTIYRSVVDGKPANTVSRRSLRAGKQIGVPAVSDTSCWLDPWLLISVLCSIFTWDMAYLLISYKAFGFHRLGRRGPRLPRSWLNCSRPWPWWRSWSSPVNWLWVWQPSLDVRYVMSHNTGWKVSPERQAPCKQGRRCWGQVGETIYGKGIGLWESSLRPSTHLCSQSPSSPSGFQESCVPRGPECGAWPVLWKNQELRGQDMSGQGKLLKG